MMPPALLTRANRPWIRRAGGTLLLLVLIALGVLRSAWGTRLDSLTVDEPYHIVAGVSYVRTGDLRLNPEHPPLLKWWVGASMPDSFALRPFRPLNEKIEERDFTEAILFADNDPAQAQASARRAVWTYHAILLFALGLLTWRAAGLAWAAGLLAVLAIEPTFAAHLPVVMTDLPLTLALGIAAVAAGLAFSTWQWRWMTVLGLAVGLALGSKHSALPGLAGLGLVGLVAAGLSRTNSWRVRFLQLAAVALLGWAALWAQYGFRFHAGADGSDAYNRPMAGKLADLKLDHWRVALQFADDARLLPRPYLWGLADTVRAGVEGRGAEHLLYGKLHTGPPPWFTWPAFLSVKVPLALWALAILGGFCLWRMPLGPSQRTVLWALVGLSLGHGAALLVSRGVYGGVRHALPLVLALTFVAAAAGAWAVASRSRAIGTAGAALWLLALGMTIREPRLWEYHNELAGGTANAGLAFANEGVDLGQRFGEFADYYHQVIKPSGRPYYSMGWMVLEEQARRSGAMYARFAASIDDVNPEARFDGYFLIESGLLLPWPSRQWDPAILAPLREVARFGNYRVLEGQIVAPRFRAASLSGHVIRYIYRTPNPDWAKVAARLEEVTSVLTRSVSAFVELGNAHLRLGRRDEAAAAFDRALASLDPGDLERVTLQAVLAQLRGGEPLENIRPVRNPSLE